MKDVTVIEKKGAFDLHINIWENFYIDGYGDLIVLTEFVIMSLGALSLKITSSFSSKG